MSFNKIIIVGYLGRDPELRYTPQSTAVCNFSVAVSEKKRDKAGDFQDITTWFRVTLWGKQAENASKYLTKGRLIYIEGRLHIEEWTDRDGKNRTTLEVTATDMQFIDNRSQDSGDNSNASTNEEFSGTSDAETSFQTNPTSQATQTSDDDIPF